jgi:hypothetical protein
MVIKDLDQLQGESYAPKMVRETHPTLVIWVLLIPLEPEWLVRESYG